MFERESVTFSLKDTLLERAHSIGTADDDVEIAIGDESHGDRESCRSASHNVCWWVDGLLNK
jgi:hypothetical protein